MSLSESHHLGSSLPAQIPRGGDMELRLRVLNCKPDAVEAALALMERHEPRSLPQALTLLGEGSQVTPPRFEIIAEAWDRYFHISAMPWD